MTRLISKWSEHRANARRIQDHLALVDLTLPSRLDLMDRAARSDAGVDLMLPTQMFRLVGGDVL
jgi:hypothetical protein